MREQAEAGTKQRTSIIASRIRVRGVLVNHEEDSQMNLVFWIPAMFILGLALMAICLLFVKACEYI